MSRNKVYTVLGASNHTKEKREVNDFYATDPLAALHLLNLESFNNIWECACGQGHLAKVFKDNNLLGKASDLIDRGYGETIDFLKHNQIWNGDIVTNPPYKYAQNFIEHGLQIIPQGNKIALFLKIQFLEGKKRKNLFKKYPPKKIYVSSSRILCAKNAAFEEIKKSGGSAVAYAWYIWENGFNGKTVVDWFN